MSAEEGKRELHAAFMGYREMQREELAIQLQETEKLYQTIAGKKAH